VVENSCLTDRRATSVFPFALVVGGLHNSSPGASESLANGSSLVLPTAPEDDKATGPRPVSLPFNRGPRTVISSTAARQNPCAGSFYFALTVSPTPQATLLRLVLALR
jgi:hypothetical protein